MLPELLSKSTNFKEAITHVQRAMLNIPSELQINLEPQHFFAPGLYARQLIIPKGTVLIGQIHKTQHLCIMYGDIEIQSEFGGGRYSGFQIFNSTAGVKRIGYAHDDTFFITLHPTDETNVEKLEELLVVDSYEEYQQFLLDHKVKNKEGDKICHSQ